MVKQRCSMCLKFYIIYISFSGDECPPIQLKKKCLPTIEITKLVTSKDQSHICMQN